MRIDHAARIALLMLLAVALGICQPAVASDAPPKATAWVGTWTAAPQQPIPGTLLKAENQTVRLIVRTSAGGAKVRVKISNLFADHPLVVGSARIARRTAGAEIDAATDRPLTFAGRTSVTIAAHSVSTSDPVDLTVPALCDLAISLFFPNATQATTTHVLALQTSYISPATGDFTASAKFAGAATMQSWPFLSAVDVEVAPPASAIVAFGDSLIDGDGSSADQNARWPDVLARRLQEADLNIGVLSQGLIGNRLLRDSPEQSKRDFGSAFGEAGSKRFERDALTKQGVAYAIIRIGTNDIAFPGPFASASEAVTAQQLIAGYRQLAAQARERGIRIIAATLSPFEDATLAAGFYTPAKDAVRRQVNAWLRSSGAFDAVIDFDAVLRDPAHPARLLPQYDSGDHLHPNDAGYAAMADAIPLALFQAR